MAKRHLRESSGKRKHGSSSDVPFGLVLECSQFHHVWRFSKRLAARNYTLEMSINRFLDSFSVFILYSSILTDAPFIDHILSLVLPSQFYHGLTTTDRIISFGKLQYTAHVSTPSARLVKRDSTRRHIDDDRTIGKEEVFGRLKAI